ncbi:MAG TPA: efflux RND transporter periplasmic adaptor subunit [Gemmatimonadaceae bacterium]
MKKLKVAAAITVLALAAGLWMYSRASAHETPAYRYATVTRGNLQSTVSATGTLGAVTTVQVGTQVSGQVSAIYADFNQKVKKGQLLARIDPTLAQQAVADAEAQLQKVQAQELQAQQVYDQDKPLFQSKYITATEFNTAQANLAVARASVKSAQVSLDKAKQNLSYTNIYSPIDGVIVERDVDVGQTVAASFSAPQLFLIANDLSQMQILASVDESDIGQIKDGQQVTFTVEAYPTHTFAGTVQQVRLQSKTTDNVVNYTVVVTVQNQDGKLLPGMTATVSFLTGSADGVLLVPNAALRFRPTPQMLASLKQTSSAQSANASVRGDSAKVRGDSAIAMTGTPAGTTRRTQGTGGQSGTATHAGARPSSALLWHVDPNGKVTATRVHVGLTDGQQTEVQGQGITAGMQIIVGTITGSTSVSTSAPSSSPFQTQSRGGFRPGGF